MIDQVLQSQAQRRRQARGLFQGRIEPLELESKERSCRVLAGGIHVEPLIAAAVHDDPPVPRIELIKRHVDRQAGERRQGLQHPLRHLMLHIGPQGHRPFAERELGVPQQGGRIRAGLRAEPFAGAAPAERTVEREVVRRQLFQTPPATIARQVLAVPHRFPLSLGHVRLLAHHVQHAFAQRHAALHRLRRSARAPRA